MAKKVSHKQLENLVTDFHKARLGLMIYGRTGVGKSDTIKNAARKMAKEEGLIFTTDMKNLNSEKHFCLIDMRVAQFDTTDIRGLPNFQERLGEKITKWFPPSFLPIRGKGIIFLDEINLAPPIIQASLYELIYDRKLSSCEYSLPEGYSMIGAGNEISDRANVFEMPAPLANRLGHLELEIPSVKDWSGWALDNDADERIIAYLLFSESDLFVFDSKNKDRAFPTPRSWMFLSKMIKGEENNKQIQILASSLIGEGTALKFKGFLDTRDTIDVDSILENPKLVKSLERLDLKYNLVTMLSERFRRAKNKKEMFEKVTDVCTELQTEYAVLTLRLMKRVDEEYVQNNISKTAMWKKRANQLGDVLRSNVGEK